jgi:hypothetical protein
MNTTQALPEDDPQAMDAIYMQMMTYPFARDPEFLSGLATILGHPDTPSTPEEHRQHEDLVLRARCFYLARKLGLAEPIDPARYEEWRQSRMPETGGAAVDVQEAVDAPANQAAALPSSDTTANNAAAPPVTENASEAPEPPYPNSFAAIVDLITRNIPVPGIEEIPPTVLEPGTSKVDHTPRRKKPWEKDEGEGAGGPSAAAQMDERNTQVDGAGTSQDTDKIDLNGHITSGQGVVKILQPNAIPDSGLLSKD